MMSILLTASLLIYLLLTIFLGARAKLSEQSSVRGFFLADSQVGWFHLALTIFATWFSTFAFLGAPGFFYAKGVSWFFTMSTFLLIAPLIAWLIGRKIWYLGQIKGYITPADLLADTYKSKRLRVLTAVLSILALIPYSLIQFIGIGKVVETSTDGLISYETAVICTMLVTALYVFWGGIRAIILTDLVQGVLFLSVVLLGAWLVISISGGTTEGLLRAKEARPDLFVLQAEELGSPLTLILIWGCGFMVLPHIWQRYYMAESAVSLVRSTAVFSSLSFVLLISMMLIGMLSIGLFSGISDTDTLVPELFKQYLPIAGTLLVLATLAAGMSTIDSQVLTSVSIVIVDFVKPNVERPLSNRSEMLISRLVAVCMILMLGYLALSPMAQSALIPLASRGTAIALLLFVPLVSATHFPAVSRRAVELSLGLGALLLLLLETKVIGVALPHGFGSAVIVFSFQATCCAVSALSRLVINPKNSKSTAAPWLLEGV